MPKLTVNEYLASLPGEVQSRLAVMRQIIREVAPQAEERISYGMPGYFFHGPLVYIGGFKNHVSLFGAGSTLMKKYADKLAPYKTSKGTIQFPLNQPLPKGLIKDFVKDRVKENEANG